MEDVAGASSSEADVQRWLAQLNDSANDREPEEFYIERNLAQERSRTQPEYAKAASSWPGGCERHFAAIESELKTLFAVPRSNCFMQWVLQYLTCLLPDRYGYCPETADATLDLLDDLYYERVSPVHMAACLRLPSLCSSILSRGAAFNQSGPLGSPLCCTLLGHAAFHLRNEPLTWRGVLQFMEEVDNSKESSSLLATVRTFVDVGADCNYRLEQPDESHVDLTVLAFLAAALAGDSLIFESVLEGGAEVKSAFTLFLKDCFLSQDNPLALSGPISELLSCAFDYTFAGSLINNDTPSDDAAVCIMEVKEKLKVTFKQMERRRLPRLSDKDFVDVARWFIVDSHLECLGRVVMDPRFDPNSSNTAANHVDHVANDGTLLHLAVSADDLEIIKLVNTSTADWSRRDASGRTPLLRIESTGALALLVNEFGLSTTDTDARGRNIWHLAAATNDVKLINWLVANDPNRSVTMNHVTLAGRTPFYEALAYISELKECPKSAEQPPRADVAHILISQEDIDCFAGDSSGDLARLAVNWGDMEILQRLAAMGVPFDGVDSNGRSLLHEVSTACTLEMVSFLIERCGNPPLTTKNELTPMDTVVINSQLRLFCEGFAGNLSNHPVNHCSHGMAGYGALCSSKAVSYRDSKGRGAWERFCAILSSQVPTLMHFTDWVDNMTHCLVGLYIHGAIKDYERQTGKAALFALIKRLPHNGEPWPLHFHALMDTALAYCDKELVSALLADNEAFHVLLTSGKAELSAFLVRAAVAVDSDSAVLMARKLVKHVIYCDNEDELSAFGYTLVQPSLLPMTPDLVDLLLLFVEDPDIHDAGDKLSYLRNLNIDINVLIPEEEGSRRTTLMHRAIELLDYPLANILGDLGADPTIGVDGDDVVTTLIRGDYDSFMLKRLLRRHDIPQSYWASLVRLPGSPACNRLDCAIQRHHHVNLASLLFRKNIREVALDASTPANQGSPAHLASLCGCRTCLELLHKSGADLSKTNDLGQTVLHVAAKMGHEELVALLLPHTNVDVADKNGKTAYDYALQHGDKVTGEFAKFFAARRNDATKNEGHD